MKKSKNYMPLLGSQVRTNCIREDYDRHIDNLFSLLFHFKFMINFIKLLALKT